MHPVARTIEQLLKQAGNADYIGESISQLEHGLQAALAAESTGHTNDVIVAALLHDVGHFCPGSEQAEQMNGFGVLNHEHLGAEWLRSLGFPDRVCRLVASHVAAKRYLCYKHPAYYQKLSPASKETLLHQGGPMQATEATVFEADPLFSLYLKLRAWDEAAKLPTDNSHRLPHFIQKIDTLLG